MDTTLSKALNHDPIEAMTPTDAQAVLQLHKMCPVTVCKVKLQAKTFQAHRRLRR